MTASSWPIDDLKRMEAAELSRWLAGWGLPAVSFVFVDPHLRRFVPWQEADEADRRHVLEAIAETAGGRGERSSSWPDHRDDGNKSAPQLYHPRLAGPACGADSLDESKSAPQLYHVVSAGPGGSAIY